MMMLLLSSYYAGLEHSSMHKAVVWWVSIPVCPIFASQTGASMASICFIHSSGEQMNWQSVVFTICYFPVSFLFRHSYVLLTHVS